MPHPTNGMSPGDVLLENFIKPLGITISQLALAIAVPPNRIYAILNNQRDISTDTALRLGQYFETGAEVWLSLQNRHNLAQMEKSWEAIKDQIPIHSKAKL